MAPSYILAKQWLTSLAVEAVATELGIVRGHTVTDLELLDVLHVFCKYVLNFPMFGSC